MAIASTSVWGGRSDRSPVLANWRWSGKLSMVVEISDALWYLNNKEAIYTWIDEEVIAGHKVSVHDTRNDVRTERIALFFYTKEQCSYFQMRWG